MFEESTHFRLHRDSAVNDTIDSSYLLKSQGGAVTELEGFIQKNAGKIATHKEGRNDDPYEFLISAQVEKLKMQSETIFYLWKEMDCKQKTIDKLLETLVVCLLWESLIHEEDNFLLRISKTN